MDYDFSQDIKLFRAAKAVNFIDFMDWLEEQNKKTILKLEEVARKMYGSKEFGEVRVEKRKIKLIKRE